MRRLFFSFLDRFSMYLNTCDVSDSALSRSGNDPESGFLVNRIPFFLAVSQMNEMRVSHLKKESHSMWCLQNSRLNMESSLVRRFEPTESVKCLHCDAIKLPKVFNLPS